jgi:hypothetical protein
MMPPIPRDLSVTKLLNALTDTASSDVWILDGVEVSTKQPLKAMFAGSCIQKNYIANLAFDGACEELHIGKKYLQQLYYSVMRNTFDCALAIIEGDFVHRVIYQGARDFYVPIWLHGSTHIPLREVNLSLKSDIRRIRKNKLDYTITKAPDQLDDFYNNMYIPTVNARHDDRTIAMDYGQMMQMVRQGHGELLQVTKEGKPIAGMVIRTDKKIPRLWSNGIRDANTVFWKDGAIGATYQFSAQHLESLGHKEMDLWLSRSFLNDGVLQYKRKWNMSVTTHDTRGFIIKPLRMSKGLAGFFAHNPFAHHSQSGLGAGVFINGEKPCTSEDIEQFRRDYQTDGLSEFSVFQIGGADGTSPRMKRIDEAPSGATGSEKEIAAVEELDRP